MPIASAAFFPSYVGRFYVGRILCQGQLHYTHGMFIHYVPYALLNVFFEVAKYFYGIMYVGVSLHT